MRGKGSRKSYTKACVSQGPGVSRAQRTTQCLRNEGLAFQVEEFGFIFYVVGIPQRF